LFSFAPCVSSVTVVQFWRHQISLPAATKLIVHPSHILFSLYSHLKSLPIAAEL
jgi:hypothetical protein